MAESVVLIIIIILIRGSVDSNCDDIFWNKTPYSLIEAYRLYSALKTEVACFSETSVVLTRLLNARSNKILFIENAWKT
jgi:hypothetical protein